MKKKIITATMIVGLMASTGMAASDQLLEVRTERTGADTYALVPVVNNDIVSAVGAFADHFVKAHNSIIEAKARKTEKVTTKLDEEWVKSDLDRLYAKKFLDFAQKRVEFYKRSHNWAGNEQEVKEYNYMSYPAGTDSYAYAELEDLTNTLGIILSELSLSEQKLTVYDVEDTIFTVLGEKQEEVQIDELRHYMSEVVWFAAKQTIKDYSSLEPENPEDNKVDLWKAIQ